MKHLYMTGGGAGKPKKEGARANRVRPLRGRGNGWVVRREESQKENRKSVENHLSRRKSLKLKLVNGCSQKEQKGVLYNGQERKMGEMEKAINKRDDRPPHSNPPLNKDIKRGGRDGDR